MITDSMLNFNEHLQSICKRASNKGRAFSGIAPNLEYEKNVMLYNYFVLSNFNYCPLIWMSSEKSSNNEINRVHKRGLRVLLDDYGSTFEELQQKRGEHTIHTNITFGGLKMLNLKNPSFLWDLCKRRPTNCNLRKKNLVQLPSTKTVRYGLNSLSFRGSMLWNTLPDIIRSAKNDRQFRNRLNNWTGSTCCI